MTSGFQSGLGRLGSGWFPAACGGGLEGAAETLELQRRLVLQWGGRGRWWGGRQEPVNPEEVAVWPFVLRVVYVLVC